MLTVSPFLKNFPRNHLHGFVEGHGLSLERGMDGLGESDAEVLKWNCHRLSRICEAKKYGHAAPHCVLPKRCLSPWMVS